MLPARLSRTITVKILCLKGMVADISTKPKLKLISNRPLGLCTTEKSSLKVVNNGLCPCYCSVIFGLSCLGVSKIKGREE